VYISGAILSYFPTLEISHTVILKTFIKLSNPYKPCKQTVTVIFQKNCSEIPQNTSQPTWHPDILISLLFTIVA